MSDGCRIMAIVAHQDDEAQAAGAILRETMQGDRAVVVWMTNGCRGWCLAKEVTQDQVVEIRRKEAEAALEILGAEGCRLDYNDSELEYNQKSILLVAECIRRYRPEIVVTHAQDTYHHDHVTTSRIVTEAVRRAGSRLTMEEIPSHHVKSLYYFAVNPATKPDLFLDITDLLEQKIAVRVAHKTQFPDEAEERFRAMAVIWGRQAGVRYAEAYLAAQKRAIERLI